MSRRSWWPGPLAQQLVVVNNIKEKIGNYEATFGWLPAQVTAVETLCTEIVQAITYADTSKATMQSVTQWRDQVLYGEPMDALASPTPEFAAPADLTFHRGCVDKLSKYRELMTANLNYTEAIGEDLMIIGDEITPVSPNVEPALKIEKSNEPSFAGTDSIVITGSMNKMNGVRIMYTVKGGVAREVGFFTSLPATVVITKTNANEPETGTIQAQYYKKNLPYGNPSPNYDVTLT